MKLALIGAGYWGKNLVRIFSQLGVLKTVCDLDEHILEEIKKEYPRLQVTTDFGEVLKNKKINAIVIATPSATHYDLTKRVLNSGKDVLVEKPLALGTREGQELLRLSQKKKLILMVDHLLLYHPTLLKLKELIRREELGNIRYIWSNRLNFGRLRQEENVLWSFAPHDISVIIDILGMPKETRATGNSYLQENILDTTLSFLEFESGEAAHIFVSWFNPFKEQKLVVIGSKATAVFDGVRNELIIYSHKVEWKNGEPKALKAKGKVIVTSKEEPLMVMAKHFLECTEKRKPPKTDGMEALGVLRVLNACQKSLNQNGKKILVT